MFTLLLIPVLKMQIKKLCTLKVTDDPLMKVIKSKVLSKFDDRFREINAGKLHQILDPETEGLVPRHKATIILETAAK